MLCRWCFFVWLFCPFIVGANEHESSVARIQAEIDDTVWQVFDTAFEGLDGDALNDLYAGDVIRVTPDGIDTRGHFKAGNRTRFDSNKKRGDKIELDFWFDSRHTNESMSYEVGFYRLNTISASGGVSSFFGQFHVVLRKTEGEWKIIQDWDTATIAGEPLSSETFERGIPVQF